MRTIIVKLILIYITITPLFAMAAIDGPLDTLNSQKLQTAFTYKFLKFISWNPPLQIPQFKLCILSKNKQLTQQLKTLQGASSLWGEIHVLHYLVVPTAQQLILCQLVYVDTDYPYHSLNSVFANNTMITVVKEDLDHPQVGLFIFLVKDNKLRFKVNLKMAREKGIKISSSLLLLASEVIEY